MCFREAVAHRRCATPSGNTSKDVFKDVFKDVIPKGTCKEGEKSKSEPSGERDLTVKGLHMEGTLLGKGVDFGEGKSFHKMK
jgi:hypothetical protein